MFKLFKNLKAKEIFYIFIALLLVLLQVYLDLKIPDFMSNVTTLIQSGETSLRVILMEGIKMLSCSLVSLLSAILVGYILSYSATSFSRTLRKKVFEKVENFSMSEIKKFSTSSLITRTTNDITQIEMLLSIGLQMLLKAPITAIWAVGKIINKSLQWSALVGAAVLVLILIAIIAMVAVLPNFKKVQKLIDKLNAITRESLMGIRVIRAFNAEDYQARRFSNANNDLTKTQMFNQRCFASLMPIMTTIMHLLTVSIYFVGAIMIQRAGLLQKVTLFSDMIVFSSYGMQVIISFLMLIVIFVMWPRASVSANRINEVLDEKSTIKNGKQKGLNNTSGTIEFKNVSFKYPDADEYLLNDISFNVNPGEIVAFIGSTGSGKSTLINLIPRFYDVTDGEILVDGINVKDYDLKYLNYKLGYVPQKAVMFTGSVKENIKFGDSLNKVTDAGIKEAIKVAQAKDFVEDMDMQYDAHIARGGSNISGGQKQRLSIARAIAKKPEIYIFDDTFSALDFKTDALLRKALMKYTKNATCLIVAQRIGTIINADKIIVLDKGKCVGIGSHKELLQNCEVYKEIALSQLSEEELANA